MPTEPPIGDPEPGAPTQFPTTRPPTRTPSLKPTAPTLLPTTISPTISPTVKAGAPTYLPTGPVTVVIKVSQRILGIDVAAANTAQFKSALAKSIASTMGVSESAVAIDPITGSRRLDEGADILHDEKQTNEPYETSSHQHAKARVEEASDSRHRRLPSARTPTFAPSLPPNVKVSYTVTTVNTPVTQLQSTLNSAISSGLFTRQLSNNGYATASASESATVVDLSPTAVPTYPPSFAPTMPRAQDGYIAAGVLGGLAGIMFISVWCYIGRETVKVVVTPVI